MKLMIINSNESLKKAVAQSIPEIKQIHECDSFDYAIDEIKEKHSQINIINWTKSKYDVPGLIVKLKKMRLQHPIYTLVIIAREDQKFIPGLMEAGCDDFLIKPFSKEELAARIKICDKIIKTEVSFSKASRKLIKYAKEDPLTGLLNRRALLDEMLKEMGRSSRDKKFLSTVMVSISNFRDLIEEHGNMSGDMILFEYALRLKSSCRPYDKMGRYGISTFLILLPDAGSANAVIVANRVLEAVSKEHFESNGIKFKINTSIGISELNPEDAPKTKELSDNLMNDLLIDSLIRRTEKAMSEAERKGPDSIEIIQF
jgi:two-component system cell cycle response regulator